MNNLVTKEDLRFVDFWKEQRKGSKLKYYLLYTLSWGLMVTLFSFFIIMFLGGISIIPIAQDNHKIALIIGLGFAAGFAVAFISRHLNEKRFQKILQKVRDRLQ